MSNFDLASGSSPSHRCCCQSSHRHSSSSDVAFDEAVGPSQMMRAPCPQSRSRTSVGTSVLFEEVGDPPLALACRSELVLPW